VFFLDILLIASAALLYAFRNVMEADTIVYYTVYESFTNSFETVPTSFYGIDMGFILFMKLFATLGIPFEIFRLIVFLLSCTLIISTVKIITKNYALVFCLYLYFPFCYDSDQIRQFFAYSIVIFGLRYLFEDKRSVLKYLICIFVSSMIHITSVVFLIYLLALLPIQKYMKPLFKGLALICIFIVFGGGNLIGFVSRFISNSKLSLYSFESTEYRMNIYLQIFEIIFFVLFVYLDNKILKNYEEDNNLRILNCILNLSIVFLPFILISLSFERLMRPFIILTYCVATIRYMDSSRKNKGLPIFIIVMLVIIRMTVSFSYILDLFNDCVLL